MSYHDQLKNIEALLLKYESIWSTEPIFNYPNLPENTEELLSELENLSDEQLYKCENLEDISFLSLRLNDYFSLIKSALIEFKTNKGSINLGYKPFLGVSAKKEHEIREIANLLAGKNFDQIIDLGSGKAHLSFKLAQIDQANSFVCIDSDEKVQSDAKNSLMSIDKEALDKMRYITQFINKETKLHCQENDLLIALHACGDLSVDILEIYNNNLGTLLNFPCCFHKLTKQNLSNKCQLHLNKFALNLANRSKVHIDANTAAKREEVKRYRYGLEIIYRDQKNKKLPDLGSAHKSLYSKSFSEYVSFYDQEKFGLLNLEENFEVALKCIKKYLLLETLRNPLARLLEQYILIDRALYLENHGVNVQIHEVFDSTLSPRNLALYAKH